jgi:hypothetical protein
LDSISFSISCCDSEPPSFTFYASSLECSQFSMHSKALSVKGIIFVDKLSLTDSSCFKRTGIQIPMYIDLPEPSRVCDLGLTLTEGS